MEDKEIAHAAQTHTPQTVLAQITDIHCCDIKDLHGVTEIIG
jgi:hypothetical protein